MRSRFVGLAGYAKSSFIDFPGSISTVLFFAGCNLRCPYCHNPGVVRSQGEGEVLSEEVWRLLEGRRGLIDGVVLSGGEPTLNPHILSLARAIALLGYRIKLDTNGLKPEVIERMAPDYLALDIKTLPDRYVHLLGARCKDPVAALTRSIGIARRMGERAEIRITVAPGIVDRDSVLGLRDLLEGVKSVYLQPMNSGVRLLDPAYESLDHVSKAEIRLFRDILGEAVGRCLIRNETADMGAPAPAPQAGAA